MEGGELMEVIFVIVFLFLFIVAIIYASAGYMLALVYFLVYIPYLLIVKIYNCLKGGKTHAR